MTEVASLVSALSDTFSHSASAVAELRRRTFRAVRTGTKGAIAWNFVMLERLGGEKPRVEGGHPAKVSQDFGTLISDAVDRLAWLSTGWLAVIQMIRSNCLAPSLALAKCLLKAAASSLSAPPSPFRPAGAPAPISASSLI
jgi:hypothetical protein